MTCIPLLGHFIPMTHLAEELISRGHEVQIITLDYGLSSIEKICSDIGLKVHTTCLGKVMEDF